MSYRCKMWLGQMSNNGLGKQDSSKSCSRKEVGFLNRKAQQRMSKKTIPSENNNINNPFLLSSSFFYKMKAFPNPKPPQWVSSFHMWSLHLKLRCLSMRFIASRLRCWLGQIWPNLMVQTHSHLQDFIYMAQICLCLHRHWFILMFLGVLHVLLHILFINMKIKVRQSKIEYSH